MRFQMKQLIRENDLLKSKLSGDGIPQSDDGTQMFEDEAGLVVNEDFIDKFLHR